MEVDTDELVIRAQNHDEVAFAVLMSRTSSASFRLALSILRDRQEAEDQVQNSYVKAWRHMGQFQREAKFSTWMTRIVTNQCLMRLRQLRRASFVHIDDRDEAAGNHAQELADHSESHETALGDLELSGIIRREINSLPGILRNVLMLRDVNELPMVEVAERLNISLSAVKSRLLRARAELRNRLERHRGIGPLTA